jgi:hypothetical protein
MDRRRLLGIIARKLNPTLHSRRIQMGDLSFLPARQVLRKTGSSVAYRARQLFWARYAFFVLEQSWY